jgi:hypothetical protein
MDPGIKGTEGSQLQFRALLYNIRAGQGDERQKKQEEKMIPGKAFHRIHFSWYV